MRAPTISEVAKTAGVSVATVSRVVNGSPSVSHETQARVQEAIERLGYQPNVWGRSLRRGESRVVLVIVPNVSNPYYAPIIAGTEDRLHEDGYSGMLCITNAEAERRALYLEFLKDGRADGAILMEPARDDPGCAGGGGIPPGTVQRILRQPGGERVSMGQSGGPAREVCSALGLGPPAHRVHRRGQRLHVHHRCRQPSLTGCASGLGAPSGGRDQSGPARIGSLPPAWATRGCWIAGAAHGLFPASPTCWRWRSPSGRLSWASGCRRTCRWWGLTMWSTP